MFKKKPNIKNLAPLRSSDRRRTTDAIISQYQLEAPKAEPTEGQSDETVNTGITTLRNSLLPEGALSAKFSTTVGPDLKTVNGTIYAGVHPGDELRVLWFKLEEKIIPTVYTLWRHPNMVALLHTPDIVLKKMRAGADLMTPGLARGPPFPPRAKKGAIVAIASYENPSVPFVVGECEIDVSALTEVRGAKGHAVRGVHWDGDEIWGWSQTGRAGEKAPVHIVGWFNEELEGTEKGVAALSLEDDGDPGGDDSGGVPLNGDSSTHNHFVEGEDVEAFEQVESKELSTKEIDDAFKKAFIYSLYDIKRKHKDEPNYGVQLPIPQSQLMSNHVMPYLPIFAEADAATLQIKKTSWKNIKKFIKALDRDVLVKSKDRNGGETVILEVDWDDRRVNEFQPYRLPKKTATIENGAQITNGGDESIGQRLKILSLYKPSQKLSPIFESAEADIRSLYLPAELRTIVNTYLKNENLMPTNQSKTITLNPVLANTIFDSNTPLDQEILARGQTLHEPLLSRIQTSGCTAYHILLRNEETRESAKPKAGLPPKIKILLETRSGNKTATRVHGLEPFHIQPALLAEELQKACASSTSVNQLVGSSPKNPVMEIMVQGPQKDAVIKALEKRGVRKDWVEVMDKTKGKKGGR